MRAPLGSRSPHSSSTTPDGPREMNDVGRGTTAFLRHKKLQLPKSGGTEAGEQPPARDAETDEIRGAIERDAAPCA